MFHKTPDYNFLKTFGCACFLFYNLTLLKLNFRSQESMFLGYSSSHKGYVRLSGSGKIYISKDVIFNEQRFPCNDIFQKSLAQNVFQSN